MVFTVGSLARLNSNEKVLSIVLPAPHNGSVGTQKAMVVKEKVFASPKAEETAQPELEGTLLPDIILTS